MITSHSRTLTLACQISTPRTCKHSYKWQCGSPPPHPPTHTHTHTHTNMPHTHTHTHTHTTHNTPSTNAWPQSQTILSHFAKLVELKDLLAFFNRMFPLCFLQFNHSTLMQSKMVPSYPFLGDSSSLTHP